MTATAALIHTAIETERPVRLQLKRRYLRNERFKIHIVFAEINSKLDIPFPSP